MGAPEPSASGFGGALESIVRELRGQPPLLYGLGGGILVIALVAAVGGIAADQLWLLVGALVLLVLAGLGAWLVIERRPEPRPELEGKNILAEDEGRILDVQGEPGGVWAPKIKAEGDIVARGGGRIGAFTSSEKPEPPPDTES
jgi:hypothetical protein